MQINRHGSFYLRNGWPTKIVDALSIDNHIFSPNSELKAVDTIGVGRVMIKSMRYWATSLGLAEEKKDSQGIFHELTPLAYQIKENDPFFTSKGTLWFLHRNLARDMENTTAWCWAFNYFEEANYTKADFSNALFAFLQKEGATYTRKTVEKEFDCFKNTYVSDEVFSIVKVIDEDTVPFFAPLNLIKYVGTGHFERRKISSRDISPLIVLACILLDNQDHLTTNKQIDLNHLLDSKCQICHYMNLSYSSLLELLQMLENQKQLHLVNNFGNQYIEIENTDPIKIISDYYNSKGDE